MTSSTYVFFDVLSWDKVSFCDSQTQKPYLMHKKDSVLKRFFGDEKFNDSTVICRNYNKFQFARNHKVHPPHFSKTNHVSEFFRKTRERKRACASWNSIPRSNGYRERVSRKKRSIFFFFSGSSIQRDSKLFFVCFSFFLVTVVFCKRKISGAAEVSIKPN